MYILYTRYRITILCFHIKSIVSGSDKIAASGSPYIMNYSFIELKPTRLNPCSGLGLRKST